MEHNIEFNSKLLVQIAEQLQKCHLVSQFQELQDLLSTLQRNDPKFHKHSLVKLISQRISQVLDEELTDQIENELESQNEPFNIREVFSNILQGHPEQLITEQLKKELLPKVEIIVNELKHQTNNNHRSHSHYQHIQPTDHSENENLDAEFNNEEENRETPTRHVQNHTQQDLLSFVRTNSSESTRWSFASSDTTDDDTPRSVSIYHSPIREDFPTFDELENLAMILIDNRPNNNEQLITDEDSLDFKQDVMVISNESVQDWNIDEELEKIEQAYLKTLPASAVSSLYEVNVEKLEVLKHLTKYSAEELVCCEFWFAIRSGLKAVLTCNHAGAVGHALELIHKLFSVDAIVGAEIYTDLLDHLLVLFKRGWNWISSPEDSHNNEFQGEQQSVIQHKIKLLQQMQTELSAMLIELPDELIGTCIRHTMLFNVLFLCHSSNPNTAPNSRFHHLIIFDPNCTWLKKWVSVVRIRYRIFKNVAHFNFVESFYDTVHQLKQEINPSKLPEWQATLAYRISFLTYCISCKQGRDALKEGLCCWYLVDNVEQLLDHLNFLAHLLWNGTPVLRETCQHLIQFLFEEAVGNKSVFDSISFNNGLKVLDGMISHLSPSSPLQTIECVGVVVEFLAKRASGRKLLLGDKNMFGHLTNFIHTMMNNEAKAIQSYLTCLGDIVKMPSGIITFAEHLQSQDFLMVVVTLGLNSKHELHAASMEFLCQMLWSPLGVHLLQKLSILPTCIQHLITKFCQGPVPLSSYLPTDILYRIHQTTQLPEGANELCRDSIDLALYMESDNVTLQATDCWLVICEKLFWNLVTDKKNCLPEIMNCEQPKDDSNTYAITLFQQFLSTMHLSSNDKGDGFNKFQERCVWNLVHYLILHADHTTRLFSEDTYNAALRILITLCSNWKIMAWLNKCDFQVNNISEAQGFLHHLLEQQRHSILTDTENKLVIDLGTVFRHLLLLQHLTVGAERPWPKISFGVPESNEDLCNLIFNYPIQESCTSPGVTLKGSSAQMVLTQSLEDTIFDFLTKDGKLPNQLLHLIWHSEPSSTAELIPSAETCECGVLFITQYAFKLGAVQPQDSSKFRDDFRKLLFHCKQTFGKHGFEFAGTVFLLLGDLSKSVAFLDEFQRKNEYHWFLWPDKLSNAAPVVGHLVESILCEEFNTIYNAFILAGYPPSQITTQFLSQCLINYLDWTEIVNCLSLCVGSGCEFIVYILVAVLAFLGPKIILHNSQKDLFMFLLENPPRFHIKDHISLIRKLHSTYQQLCSQVVQLFHKK